MKPEGVVSPATVIADVSSSQAASPGLRLVKVVFTGFALLAMAFALWKSQDFLVGAWAKLAPGNIVAAILLWAATHAISPLFLTTVLGAATPLPYRRALAVHALRLPAKYLPGGIWHMVGRVTDLRAMGHSRQSLVEFVLIENLVAAGFALGVGAALLFAFGDTQWRWLTGTSAVCGLAGLLILPRTVKLVSRSQQLFPAARYGRLLGVTIVFWAIASAAFAVFAGGFDPPVFDSGLPETIGAYLFSWGAGFIAFFAPQGVGVFEFIAGTLLAANLDLSQAVALMASFRIIVLAGDVAAWATAVTLFRRFSAE